MSVGSEGDETVENERSNVPFTTQLDPLLLTSRLPVRSVKPVRLST